MRTILKKEEKILVIIRQHWVKLVLPIFVWVLAAVLLIWLLQVTGFLITLLLALYPFYEYLNWKNNLWCVTNLRVVDESGFFSRYSKESPIDKINNVEYDQSLLGRIFGFGTVDIQTAAELGETTYEMIHHPKLLKDTITQAQEEYKRSQINHQAQQLATAIAQSIPTQQHASPTQVADEIHKLFELLQKGAITQEEYLQQKAKWLQ